MLLLGHKEERNRPLILRIKDREDQEGEAWRQLKSGPRLKVSVGN